MISSRLRYLLRSALHSRLRSRRRCPSCGCEDSDLVARKYLVTTLRRCRRCRLQFRVPTTTPEEDTAFYQAAYRQGFTTTCPSEDELAAMMANGFADTGKDYSTYIELIFAAGVMPGSRILDVGCSWGYGSWQFTRAGFDVVSVEISVPRADYARDRLGCCVYDTIEDTDGSFDLIFSAHVIEHLASPGRFIAQSMSRLRRNGRFIAISPNGSRRRRETYRRAWISNWGMVHPCFMDDEYYAQIFKETSFFLASDPYPFERIRSWMSERHAPCIVDDLSTGHELAAIVHATEQHR